MLFSLQLFLKLTCMLLAASSVIAAPADQTTTSSEPLEWYGQLTLKAKKVTPGHFPHRILIIKEFDSDKIPKVDVYPAPDPTAPPSFLELVTKEEFDSFIAINGMNKPNKIIKGTDKDAEKSWIKFFLSPALANTVVVAPAKEKNWTIHQLDATSNVVIVHTDKKAKKPATASDYIQWISHKLGYDGVILDQKGDLILIGLISSIPKGKKIQALAVKDSANKYILVDKNSDAGASMLQLQSSAGSLATFSTLLAAKGAVNPIGTKILLQK